MQSKPTRVPIPLSEKERKQLKGMAAKEIRSESAMARIIYLAGLKQLSEKK
ncbi:hypothetical protein [Duganella rivi]|uniref:hypothetical protein n=1 Tax=Duganella rivi TaxID=2666083 RepID=UPI00140CB921|nr:hypothetical protein [Duganella rivi]